MNRCEFESASELIDAFESTYDRDRGADVADFLPQPDHPEYREVLCELLRIDLEHEWERGYEKSADEYRSRFPEVFEDSALVSRLRFEESRLRQLAVAGAQVREGCDFEESASKQDADFHYDWTRPDPRVAEKVLETMRQIPPVGSTFCGFRLVEELGRGAFSRVFLATDERLADRYVALKVSTQFIVESQTLAQLQHTNIVPIYSVHRTEEHHAICMPYLGSTTLHDAFRSVQGADSLLQSQRSIFETIHHRKGSTLRGQAKSHFKVGNSIEPGTTAAVDSEALDAALKRLKAMSYVESVLWVFSRLGQGLAHAHERGILHRDIKPANILIRDDGEPMLLDFNLSEDLKAPAHGESAFGGTLPYMAPEHLRAFLGESKRVDERADIYSLGIILYEMLTGRSPFPSPSDTTPPAIAKMITERAVQPPAVRRHSRMVTPAIDAIVHKCLAPHPEDRYQSAREFYEDIDCQLADLPLRHTPEPSRLERARKWVRRHPRATSSTSIFCVCAASVLVLAVTLTYVGRELGRHRAVQALAEFDRDKSDSQFHLEIREPTDEHLDAGLAAATRGTQRYNVLANPRWKDEPLVRNLAVRDRRQLEADMSELLQLMAWAKTLRADTIKDEASIETLLAEAWQLTERAESIYPDATKPRALLLQKAEILRRRGDTIAADKLLAEADTIPLISGRDRFLLAREHFLHERFKESAAALVEAIAIDRQNFRFWFLLGRSYDSMGQNAEAAVCYTACTVLRPDFVWAFFNLGLAQYRQRHYLEAVAAFTQAIALKPDLADAYVNRALARQQLPDYASAIADLDEALRLDESPTRVYFLRSRIRERADDAEGARRDFELGMAREPKDELSWITRGVARTKQDPSGALADYEQALALNSRSQAALQNKAHVLSEHLGRREEAIATLDQLLRLYPNYVRGRCGRGVLLARAGKRQAALADAQMCLDLDRSPEVLYQVACIYAQTSLATPADAGDAISNLSESLRKGYGRTMIETDADLDPLRNRPDFQRLVQLARGTAAADRPARNEQILRNSGGLSDGK